MLTFHQTVRQRIGNVIVQYRLLNINEPVVITFPPADTFLNEQQAAEEKSPWGFNFLARQNVNVVSFQHIGYDNQFCCLELIQFINKLGAALSVFPERLGYGISKGGFAISLHADNLGLDRALLLMPLSSYDVNKVPWEIKAVRASKVKNNQCHLFDASICKIPLTIIYDPLFKPDRLHVERYTCEVKKLKIPGVGHRIPRALQDLGELKHVIMDYVDNKLDSESFPAKVRARKHLACYHKGMSENSTGKLTLKRKKVIYYHKVLWKLKHIEEEPRKIAKRLQESIQKRISTPQKLMLSSKNFIPAKIFVASNFFVFC